MQDPAERRIERRRSVFLQASICAMDGTQITNCSIQDTSRSGCKIISDELNRIPDEMIMSILGETFVGRVMWRDGDMAGVEFISSSSQ
jgi:hypothetical protein